MEALVVALTVAANVVVVAYWGGRLQESVARMQEALTTATENADRRWEKADERIRTLENLTTELATIIRDRER